MPQILLLSGVGPADHLKERGIPVVADLPGVGSHLMDHLVIDLNIKDKSKSSISHLKGDSFLNGLKLMREVFKYNLTGRGPLTTNVSPSLYGCVSGGLIWAKVAETIGFVRSTDPKLFPPEQFPPGQIEDATSGPGAPDIEVFFTPTGYLQHGQAKMRPDHYFALHGVLLRYDLHAPPV